MPAMSLVAFAVAFLKVLIVVVIALTIPKFVILLDVRRQFDPTDCVNCRGFVAAASNALDFNLLTFAIFNLRHHLCLHGLCLVN